jgi:Carbon-nitrogen hydrolase.
MTTSANDALFLPSLDDAQPDGFDAATTVANPERREQIGTDWLQQIKPIFINLVFPLLLAQLAYSGIPDADPRWFVVTALLPALWVAAPNRWWGGITFASYMLIVGRGIPDSTAAFYADPAAYWTGVWMLATIVGVQFAIGAGCWSKLYWRRIAIVPALLLLWVINPIGFGNPLQSAGWLFPGEGGWGLIATVLLMLMISVRWYAALIIPLFVLLPPPEAPVAATPTEWHTHNTEYRFGVGMEKNVDRLAEYQRHRTNLSAVDEDGVHLFPETVGGIWNQAARQLWMSELLPGQTILLGTYVPTPKGLVNTVMQITSSYAMPVYQQRLPVPIVMWRPWSQETTAFLASSFTGNPLVDGKSTAFLLCYETLVAAPVLQSLLRAATDQPQQLVSLSSVWWSPHYIKDAQTNAVRAWGKLYGIPVYMAFN